MDLNVYGNANPDAQREVLDGLPVLVFLERAGKIVFANAEARQLLGMAEGEWIPRPVEDVLWGLFPGTAEPQTLLTGTRHGSPFHATLPAPNGRLVPVEGTYSISNAQLREAVIVAHPSEKERAPKSRLMEDVLSSLPEAVAIEHQNHVLYTNPAFTRMFGYTAEEAGGGSLRELIVPETRLNENATLLRVVDDRGSATVETVRTNKAGELVDVSMQIAPLLVDGAKVGYVFTFRDIGEVKQTEAKLQHDAMHDVLTGLPNRALFLDRLNLTLTRRLRHPDNGCGVLYMDLDNFKAVNDSLGHAAGDVLLMAIAGRLRSSLRPQDSAARLGGDEFAVLVENIVTAYDLEVVARRILHELERPFDIFGHTVHAGASIGAAMAGPEHTSSDLLLRDADFAMYRAKQAGRGRYEIFDKHLEVCVTSQQERERELRTALDKRQFTFLYQPIYRLTNGKLEGFESLLCLRRADGSIEDVDGLLAVAEDTGLSIALGQETLDTVCAQLRSWSETLPKLGSIPVRQPDAPADFQHRFDRPGNESPCGQRRRSVAPRVRGSRRRPQRDSRCRGCHPAAPCRLPGARSHRRIRQQPCTAESSAAVAPCHGQARAQAHSRRRFDGPSTGCTGVARPPLQHIEPACRRPGNRDPRAGCSAGPHRLHVGSRTASVTRSQSGTCAGTGANGLATCRVSRLILRS